MTDSLLADSYGTSADEARTKCKRDAGRHPETGIKSYELLDTVGGCARAEVVDQAGRRAILVLTLAGGQWSVAAIADPSTPTPGEVACPPNSDGSNQARDTPPSGPPSQAPWDDPPDEAPPSKP